MLRTPILVMAAVVVFSFNSSLSHADDPFVTADKISNAALVYWQAFALLPDLSEEETKQLDQIEKGGAPVSAADSILARSETALRLAQNINPQTDCRWELVEGGPGTMLPHLGKARLLARLMVAKARSNANHGQSDAAVARLADAFTLSRNIDEGVLVQMLVSDSIETTIMDAATPLISKLGPDANKRLGRHLNKLAPRSTFAKAIEYERDVFAEWMRAVINSDKDDAQDSLKQLGFADDSLDIEQILEGTEQDRKNRFDEFLSEYTKTIAASKLSTVDAQKEYKRLEEGYKKSSNPLVRLLMPSAERASQMHSKVADRFAKFETAVRDAT